MEWVPSGRPKLLNPVDDDPSEFLSYDLSEETLRKARGRYAWVDPVGSVGSEKHTRSEYTIRRLKLNLRASLRDAREKYFLAFCLAAAAVLRDGPEVEIPPGISLGDRLLKDLSKTGSHLGPIRQWMATNPEQTARLFDAVPGLREVVAEWNPDAL